MLPWQNTTAAETATERKKDKKKYVNDRNCVVSTCVCAMTMKSAIKKKCSSMRDTQTGQILRAQVHKHVVETIDLMTSMAACFYFSFSLFLSVLLSSASLVVWINWVVCVRCACLVKITHMQKCKAHTPRVCARARAHTHSTHFTFGPKATATSTT